MRWEARVFVPFSIIRGTEEATIQALCNILAVPFRLDRFERRTDLYLVGSDPHVGLKYRGGEEEGGELELKRTEERTPEGAERISKTTISASPEHRDPTKFKRVAVEKKRWADGNGREVTYLGLDQGSIRSWVSLSVESIPKEKTAEAITDILDGLRDLGYPRGQAQVSSYPRWLHDLLFAA